MVVFLTLSFPYVDVILTPVLTKNPQFSHKTGKNHTTSILKLILYITYDCVQKKCRTRNLLRSRLLRKVELIFKTWSTLKCRNYQMAFDDLTSLIQLYFFVAKTVLWTFGPMWQINFYLRINCL